MNGDWFPWGQRPEVFRAAWRHAHAQVRIGNGEVLQRVWIFTSPMCCMAGRRLRPALPPIIPATTLMNMILMWFSILAMTIAVASLASYDDIFSDSLNALATYGKPLWIAEIGCVDDAQSQLAARCPPADKR